jgi:hypothetical protein
VAGDLAVSLETVQGRAQRALLAAAGVLVEPTAPRERVAVHDTLPVTVAVYNQGKSPIAIGGASVWMMNTFGPPTLGGSATTVLPDSAAQLVLPLVPQQASVPWWMEHGMQPGTDQWRIDPHAPQIAIGADRVAETHTRVALKIAGVPITVDAGPAVHRFADPARGELRRPVVSVPPIGLLFDDEVEYVRAGVPLDRVFTLHVTSAASAPRSVTVALTLPAGLKTDSLIRHVALEPYGSAALGFHVTGRLPVGRHFISAMATSNGHRFLAGWVAISYQHIRPLLYYPPSAVQIEAVDATLPSNPRIAYVRGVSDNVAPMLRQLGLQVTVLPPELLATADLSRYGAVVVGPRAFAASPLVAASARRLQDYARDGGTVVVQYGQQEMQTPGYLPYPVTLARVAQRVTDETAPVRIIDPGSRLLTYPNRIVPADFDQWVQERATYMPTTADPHYHRLLEMHDPGEPPNENAVLVAPLGKGAFVYTTLALFRQLPAGVPGGARIFLNLLAADGRSPASAPPQP